MRNNDLNTVTPGKNFFACSWPRVQKKRALPICCAHFMHLMSRNLKRVFLRQGVEAVYIALHWTTCNVKDSFQCVFNTERPLSCIWRQCYDKECIRCTQEARRQNQALCFEKCRRVKNSSPRSILYGLGELFFNVLSNTTSRTDSQR